MRMLYDASNSLCCEAGKSMDSMVGCFDGVYTSGEFFFKDMDIIISPHLSFCWRLIKGLCDDKYERTPNMAGAKVKNDGKYTLTRQLRSFSSKGKYSEERDNPMFNGNLLLDIKYKIDKDYYTSICEILRELEKRVLQTLIVTNQDFQQLCRVRENVKQIKIAATHNQAYRDMLSRNEADYVLYDFGKSERLGIEVDMQTHKIQSRVMDYIRDEISIEDVLKLESSMSKEEFLQFMNILQNKGFFDIKFMKQLLHLISRRKLIQARESLETKKKTIVISSSEYESYIPDLMTINKGDDLIVSTKNPVLAKTRETA